MSNYPAMQEAIRCFRVECDERELYTRVEPADLTRKPGKPSTRNIYVSDGKGLWVKVEVLRDTSLPEKPFMFRVRHPLGELMGTYEWAGQTCGEVRTILMK